MDRWVISQMQTRKPTWRAALPIRFDNIANALYRYVWDEYLRLVPGAGQVRSRPAPGPATGYAPHADPRAGMRAAPEACHSVHAEELWRKVSVVAGSAGAWPTAVGDWPYPQANPAAVDAAAEADVAES